VGEGTTTSVNEMRVLVVEDEAPARDLLVAVLRGDGYTVHAVEDGKSALDAAESFRPDIALLDGGLPGIAGSELASRLRATSNLPIIFVTAADSAEAVHRAFRVGADDYITKPFDPEELSWRVKAVLRRTGHTQPRVWQCGDLVVDDDTQAVTRAGAPVALTATEFKLLRVLIRNQGRIVPKEQLLAEVWANDADNHLLEVHISSLRRKVEAHGPRMIHTVRATGYLVRP
jgi:two-component system, OmpR family, response regulator